MLKVLVNCDHNEGFGGGCYYAYQTINAIAESAKIFLTNKPNRFVFLNRPELKFKYQEYKEERVDCFLDISWFRNTYHEGVPNMKLSFFPRNYDAETYNYDKVVTLSKFSQKWFKRLLNKDTEICQPYSRNIKPGKKKKNTIVYVGNFAGNKNHTKGQDTILRVFGALPKEWELNLIGSPEEPRWVDFLREKSAGLNVKFHLSIPDEEKEAILRRSEFFWSANGFGSPSIGGCEHFGIAVEEAIKAGCLTYVHNSGGARDFATHWDSMEELYWKTLNRFPNKKGVTFQTPEKMAEFWKNLL